MNIRWRFHPGVRLKFTLLYGGLFLAAGAVLLTLNFYLFQRAIRVDPGVLRQRVELRLGRPLETETDADSQRVRELFREAARELRTEHLHELLVQSGLALGLMAGASLALGWIAAGRVLRPLKEITATAKRLTEETLHERIDLEGPHDELKELADTFDGMLERLDAAFAAQRRFVDNASHELRTPLSIIRTEVDVALADPDATVEELRDMAHTVRDATVRSERMIDSLLALARSDAGTETRQRLDLAELAREVVVQLDPPARDVGLRVETSLRPAVIRGDRELVDRLVGNLVENAIQHNHPGGWIEVTTGSSNGTASLEVRNSGSNVEPESVDSLFEPFRRMAPDRTGSRRSVGLGLSIVRSVVAAHRGAVHAVALPGGGLDVRVDLPAAGP